MEEISSSGISKWLVLANLIIFSLLSAACGEKQESITKKKDTAVERKSGLSEDQLEELENLGYVNWVPVDEKDSGSAGVTEYIPELSYQGLNLYNSRARTEAHLITMDGRVVHTWSSDEAGSAKQKVIERFDKATPRHYEGWNHIEMDKNGNLFVIGSHHMLLKLDWYSNVKWKAEISAHHDISISENGDIYTIVDVPVTVNHSGRKLQVLDNHIVILSQDGKVKRRISIIEVLKKNEELERELWKIIQKNFPENDVDLQEEKPEKSLIKSLRNMLTFVKGRLRKGRKQKLRKLFKLHKKLYREIVSGNSREDDAIKIAILHLSPADVLHSNTIEVIETARKGFWKQGDMLICIRELNLIAVIDPDIEEVVWSWGMKDLDKPHQPSVLPNGNIIVFDNGAERRFSRIVEVDPEQKSIVWTYKGNPSNSFFSKSRGGCQKLGNGNVLITETNKGRVFEVTTDGQVVWSFYNPDFKKPESIDEKPKRGGIYRMVRIDESILKNIIEKLPVE
ncbi:MAG: arylsulfotransferase family protein [Candidatus Glassbacteria bacterium]